MQINIVMSTYTFTGINHITGMAQLITLAIRTSLGTQAFPVHACEIIVHGRAPREERGRPGLKHHMTVGSVWVGSGSTPPVFVNLRVHVYTLTHEIRSGSVVYARISSPVAT